MPATAAQASPSRIDIGCPILYISCMHNSSQPPRAHCAFSLVELSIVLVILGLLIGGILSGQALIRAAELRSVSTEFSKYAAAAYSFRDKYFYLPGDLPNAYAFWGAAAGCTNAVVSDVDGSTGCNGDGNGSIVLAGVSNGWIGEGMRAWWMLQSAGLIEGNFGAGAITNVIALGANVPKAKLNNAGWSVQTSQFAAQPMGWGTYGATTNWLMLGSYVAGNPTINVALKPEEAWNIDTKMDDGKPGTGKVMGGDAYIGGSAFANRCVDARSATGNYDLLVSAVTCNMGFAF
jgi:prepilin-type N-terminal cleavage/methylation domain-containing protein